MWCQHQVYSALYSDLLKDSTNNCYEQNWNAIIDRASYTAHFGGLLVVTIVFDNPKGSVPAGMGHIFPEHDMYFKGWDVTYYI